MKIDILKLVVFLVVVFCACGANDEDKGDLNLTLEVNTESCNCEHESQLKIINRKTGLSKIYKNGLKRIDEKELLDDKLIIIGEGMRNIPLVCIVNINTLELIDSFYCYYPKISNDKKYLLGVKFVARYGPERLADQIIFKYDIENLNSEAVEEVGLSSIKEIVGTPIYPESNKRANTFKTSEINPKNSGTLRGTFVFHENSYAVFLYLKGEKLDLVYVNLREPETKKMNLNMHIEQVTNNEKINLKRIKIDKCSIEDSKVYLTTNVIEELRRPLVFQIELVQFTAY